MNKNIDRPTFLIRTKSLREILSDLRKAKLWLMVAAFAAFLASAFFVVKYFVGGEMIPSLWSNEQWMNAFLGLGITAVITAAQSFLYASGYKGHAALIAAFIVVFFGLFSEISQSMEREDASVKNRSQNSPVFQATLGSISALTNKSSAPVTNPYAHSIAKAQQKLNRCIEREKAGKEKHCNGDRGYLESLQAQGAAAIANSQGDTQAALSVAISSAKALEYDEEQHYAMIRLLKKLFGVDSIWASFLFSIIIIGTFEYAFHFVGAFVSDHKQALLMMGRDSQGRQISHDTDPTPPGDRNVPTDHGNKLRKEYMDWVSPERNESPGDTNIHAEATEQPDKLHDFTQKRFFKLIYTEVRHLVLSGDIQPTVRPVTDAVTTIIRHKSHLLGIKPSMMGKPQRQQIAVSIIEKLEEEGVVSRNREDGVGKPKHVLAPKFLKALQMKREDAVASGESPTPMSAPEPVKMETTGYKPPVGFIDTNAIATPTSAEHPNYQRTARDNKPLIGKADVQLDIPQLSTYNAELAEHNIDSPEDAAMNQRADKADIERIIAKGKQTAGHPSSDRPDALAQNRPTPHPDAAPDALTARPEDRPEDGQSATEQMADPSNFALLKSYVQHEKFDRIFIAIAIGAKGCSQRQIKTFGVGGDLPKWVMVIMDAWEIVSEPNTNNQRTLIRKLTTQEAEAELADVKSEILGKETSNA